MRMQLAPAVADTAAEADGHKPGPLPIAVAVVAVHLERIPWSRCWRTALAELAARRTVPAVDQTAGTVQGLAAQKSNHLPR